MNRKTLYPPGVSLVLWVIILLCSFFLRVYALADIPLNVDELRQVEFVHLPAGEMVTTYHTANHILSSLLAYVSIAWGENLLMLRWPSVILGVLGVAAIARVGRILFGFEVALVSAGLAAVSLLQLDYSQQLRGYAGLFFFVTLSFYFLWAALRSNLWGWWVAFALTAALATYIHLFGGLVLGAQGVIMAVWLIKHYHQRAWRQTLLWAIISLLLCVLLTLLFLSPVIPQILQVGEREQTHASEILPLSSLAPWSDKINAYTAVLTLFSLAKLDLPGWIVLVHGGLALLGLAVAVYRREWVAVGILAAWLALPLVLGAIGLEVIPDFYIKRRFMIVLLPAYIILMSRGLIAVWRGIVAKVTLTHPVMLSAAVVLLLLLNLPLLQQYYRERVLGDWLQVNNYLAIATKPEDLVICEAYHHRWDGRLGWDQPTVDDCRRSITYHLNHQFGQRLYPVLTLDSLVSIDNVSAYQHMMSRTVPVWLVIWGIDDPQVATQLKGRAVFSRDRFGNTTAVIGPSSGGVLVDNLIRELELLLPIAPSQDERFAHLVALAELYAAVGHNQRAAEMLTQAATVPLSDPLAVQRLEQAQTMLTRPPLMQLPNVPMSVGVGHAIRFNGYSLNSATVVPGDRLNLTLFWEALPGRQDDYTVFLHMRDESNRVVVQQDFEPSPPTSVWQPGDKISETRELVIPPGTPAARYRLLVGMYRLDTLERLPVLTDATGENVIELVEVQVR